MLAVMLERAVKAAGVPVIGVSIGNPNNKATWKVHPPDLQASAQATIDSFVIPTSVEIADEEARREVREKKLRAVTLALLEAMPEPKPTPNQLFTRAKEIYKTL